MNLYNILTIARKDLVDAIKNSYILIAIILPAGISILLKIVFPAGGEDLIVNVGVYDPGESRFVAQLQAHPNVHLIRTDEEQEVQEITDKGETVGGIVVPLDFDQKVDAGQQPQLEVYVNSRAGISEQTVFRSLIEEQVWELVDQKVPARINVTDVSNPDGQDSIQESTETMFLIMLIVMVLVIVGTFVVPTLLVEEKERQTMLALQVSPASAADIVVGKLLVGLFYALLMVLIILTLNQGWGGHLPLTLLAVLLGALFVVLLGLLMGSLFNTANEINTWSSVIMLALMVPSWTTMLQVPDEMGVLFHFLPTYYLGELINASTGDRVVWNQAGPQIAALLASVLITFVIAVWGVRRETVR